jgi:type IV pilus assembly protein PilQ
MKSCKISGIVFLSFFLVFVSGCATKGSLTQTTHPPVPAQGEESCTIEKISFSEEENYTRVRIEGTKPIPTPFYNVLNDPLRIVIDVPKADLKEIKESVKVDNGTIGAIVATQYDDKGRIEIGLLQMTNYNIVKQDKVLVVDVEKVKKIAEVKEQKEEETIKEKGAELPPVEPKKDEVVASPGPAAVPEAMNKAKEIVDFSFLKKEDSITFEIRADGKIGNYDSFKLDSPPRLVLDVWEVSTRYPKKSVKVKDLFIKEVRIGHHPDKVRLVFDSLKSPLPPYQINRADDKLLIAFGNVPGPSEAIQEKVPAATEKAKPTKPILLTGIDFKQIDHKSRIVVTGEEEPKLESYMISKKVIAVDIKNAYVPKKFQRSLNTSEFKGAVNSVNAQNIRVGKGNDARILIKLKEAVPYQTSIEGKAVLIDIEAPKREIAQGSAIPKVEKEEAPVEAGKEKARTAEEAAAPVSKKAEIAPAEAKEGVPPASTPKQAEEVKQGVEGTVVIEKSYQGRKVSLDFKDADIKNILRLIAEVSNLNIIAGEDVGGKVTMRLVDVPWDQALDVVLQARALGMSRVGNVIRVAPLETLKKETQTELEGKRVKEKLEDLSTELVSVNYATAKDLLPQVKSILSDRGDVKVDDRTNTLIIKDISKSIVSVRGLVKSLDTKTPQVLIEARIIEANLTFQKELGVQWGLQVQGGTGKKKTTTVQGGNANNQVVDLPAIPASGAGAPGILEFLFNSQYALKQLDVAISAHESQGDVKIISSPKIVTLDNKEASIEQGLRIPYPRRDETTGNISVEFAEADLKLTVTPQVTNDGNIKLRIKAKKDAPDFSITVQEVPAIDKKEAITEVMIKDTGVVVIGGVYTIQKTNNNEGIPLFNKIPLLGWLFKRESKDDTRKDLLIFISPKIIKDEV